MIPAAGREAVHAGPSVREAIRTNIRKRAAQAGLKGYIASTPSNVTYVSGYLSYFLTNWWRMHGTVMVVLDTEGDDAPCLILGDPEEVSAREAAPGCDVYAYPMWTETRDLAGIRRDPGPEPSRPTQWREDIDMLLREVLERHSLLTGRVGADLRDMPQRAYERLHRVAPDVEWVDMTEELYEIRAIKWPFEVARLRAAAELAEAGMMHAARHARVGVDLQYIRSYFYEGVAVAVRTGAQYAEFSDVWVIPGMGSQATISATGSADGGMKEGDLLKFDCGTVVGGYRSDHGRTFVLGQPSPQAQHLYDSLRTAHSIAIEQMKPGRPVSVVYRSAAEHMRSHGYPGYRRGHFGHSLGLDSFHEEPPFLGPNDSTLLVEGMVFAVEVPFYGADVGPIMLEDLVIITSSGAEYLTSLSQDLVPVGSGMTHEAKPQGAHG
jgi:Xaa-Pro aminopeptidase